MALDSYRRRPPTPAFVETTPTPSPPDTFSIILRCGSNDGENCQDSSERQPPACRRQLAEQNRM